MSDDPEHRALPLAWSPQGWGVYVNTMRRVEHAVGAAPAESAYVLTVDDAVLDLFLFAGEPGEILNQYTALTGRAGQPVLWAMGAWLQQASGEMPTQTVALLARMRENQIPVDAVTLPSRRPGASCPTRPCSNGTPSASRMPSMLALFHKHNVHVAASGFPGVLKSSPLFEELEDRGWLLSKDDGSAQVFDGIPATSGQPYGLLDLTYRDIYNLWVERHRQLIEDGSTRPPATRRSPFPTA